MFQIRAYDGGEFNAHIATPRSGKGAGIVLLQEIFGVNQFMRQLASHYAALGFTVVCPDLFWRQEPGVELTDQTEAEWQRAFELYKGLDEVKAVQDAAAAMDALRTHPACTGRVGAVGFCLGGKLAYLIAARYKPDCSAGYYGVGIENALGESANITTPLMLHIAVLDKHCDAEAQRQIHGALGANPLATIHNYENDGHAFARPGSEHYDSDSAELANLRTLEFFVRHLVAGGPEN